MNKSKKVLYTIICIIVISISIVRIGEIFFTVFFNSVLWCDKEDKEYIKSHSNISSNFSIAVATSTTHLSTEKTTVMSGYPTIFTKIIDIDDSAVNEYIAENGNGMEVFIKCSLPYIVAIVIAIQAFRKKLLPAFND